MKSLEKLKRYDVITFSEDDKVVVIDRYDYNDRKFVYVNEILPDESDVTDVYKVMEIHIEKNTLEKVVNPELLQKIIPQFYKRLEGFVTDTTERVDKTNSIANVPRTFKELDCVVYSLKDYEKIVEKAMNEQDIEPLIQHSEKLICSNKPIVSAFAKDITYTGWLEFLNRNGSKWAQSRLITKYSIVEDYDMVSWTYQCFIKGLEERGDSIEPELYYLTGYYKYMQVNDDLPWEEMIRLYEGKILAAGQWYKKALEAGYNEEDIEGGKWCISHYENYANKRMNNNN